MRRRQRAFYAIAHRRPPPAGLHLQRYLPPAHFHSPLSTHRARPTPASFCHNTLTLVEPPKSYFDDRPFLVSRFGVAVGFCRFISIREHTVSLQATLHFISSRRYGAAHFADFISPDAFHSAAHRVTAPRHRLRRHACAREHAWFESTHTPRL